MAERGKKTQKMCEKCGKEFASITVVQVIGGKKKKFRVCESCAMKVGLEEQMRVADIKEKEKKRQIKQNESKMYDLVSKMSREESRERKMVCTTCGMSYFDFKRELKFGCPDCYEAFKTKIAPIIHKIHGAYKHVEHEEQLETSGAMLPELKTRLKIAIEDEDFEEAARLRDLIKESRNDLG
ncbi:UvrB/UvrC motif-containing protein [bacterium]|nr:UvrB/UvrC motif-containing protein [bacterium]